MVSTYARILRAVLAWAALAIGLFFLAGWIGSSIPRNRDWRELAPGAPAAVTIYVETNGVHTALVLPKYTPSKDWSETFPLRDIADPSRPYTHVSVSWGERQVFLETPTWADLSPVTVLRILGFGSEGLVHVAHYVRPAPADDIRPLRITPEQYAAIVRRIEAMLPPGPVSEPRRHYPGYGDHDAFYESRGRYTAVNTCNQWTTDTLAAAGVRTGLWTPFAGGVMKWVPKMAERTANDGISVARLETFSSDVHYAAMHNEIMSESRNDPRMVLFEAIARKRAVTAEYNGVQMRLAPHVLFERRGDLFLSALNMSKNWRSDDEKHLGYFKLDGLAATTLTDEGFDPLPAFEAAAPHPDDTLVLAV